MQITQFINKLNMFARYNMQYIRKINFEIINLNHENNYFYKNAFRADLYFTKNDIDIYKKFQSSDLVDLVSQIEKYIQQEIKL